MNKIKKIVFWHNYLVNDWEEVIADQFKTLYQSGLYDAVDNVFCGVIATRIRFRKYCAFMKNLVSSYTATNKLVAKFSKKNYFEYLTLSWLKEFCDTNDAYVLYFHTKGISRPVGTNVKMGEHCWRKYMEYFDIWKWKNCVEKLEQGYDCCGVGYRHRKFYGNFWWANSNYIKILKSVSTPKNTNLKRPRKQRFYYEKWLFKYYKNCETPPTNIKILNIHTPVGLYKGQKLIYPEQYEI